MLAGYAQEAETSPKGKADIAAAALGQVISSYFIDGLSQNGNNTPGTLSASSLDQCCKDRLKASWEQLSDLKPDLSRNILKYTSLAVVIDKAPPHIHHAALRSHISDKHILALSRHLHGVSMPAFTALLPTFTSLLRIDLSYNALTEDDMPDLGAALATLTSLLHLDLSSNSIGEDGAASLGAALSHLRHLRHLALNSTQLEDEGVAHIARALATPMDVRHLSLSQCGITEDGAQDLKDGLAALPKLSYIDLRGNELQVLPSAPVTTHPLRQCLCTLHHSFRRNRRSGTPL